MEPTPSRRGSRVIQCTGPSPGSNDRHIRCPSARASCGEPRDRLGAMWEKWICVQAGCSCRGNQNRTWRKLTASACRCRGSQRESVTPNT
eukprot:3137742-Rhodomonas_salina.1